MFIRTIIIYYYNTIILIHNNIMYGHHHHILARVWINRVRLSILLVVSSTGKMNISLPAFVPENLVSRDGFGSPVPCQSAHLHTQAESGAYLRDSSRFPRRRPFLNRHTPLGQCRVYRVTRLLRTNGVHRRYFQHAHFIPIVGVGKRGEY